MMLLYVVITCPLPFLAGFIPNLRLPLLHLSIYVPTSLVVGMIILLVGIPLALALRDLALLMATIFSLIQVLATFAYPSVWRALMGSATPDFSILYMLISVSWWLYFYFVGWRKPKRTVEF